jgi:uncharacterized coiled-coil protein SlyX
MVKEEVRRVGAGRSAAPTDDAWVRVAELESLLAEQSVHQARVMARVADEIAALSERVGDLEHVVRALAAVTAPPMPEDSASQA